METQQICIFRTSVDDSDVIKQLSPYLNALAGEGGEWNFDLEDCDKVFRIKAKNAGPEDIKAVFQDQGHFIEELED